MFCKSQCYELIAAYYLVGCLIHRYKRYFRGSVVRCWSVLFMHCSEVLDLERSKRQRADLDIKVWGNLLLDVHKESFELILLTSFARAAETVETYSR